MDAHSRRQTALAAIEQILNGARPADLESETLDFKEESGTVRSGQRQPIPLQHEPAAKALVEEVACFANSRQGGVLVVGVDDKASGPAAFVGTYLDTTWLRERIYALTQPHLAVDVIEELQVASYRLYLINVAPALEETHCDGRLRARFGSRCQDLSGDQARRLLEERRRYDWSAEPSGFHQSDVDPISLAIARHHYQQTHGRVPQSSIALASQLGLYVDGTPSDNPELNNAGALLFARLDPATIQFDCLSTRAEGVPSLKRVELVAPLLSAFEDAWRFVEDSFPAAPMIRDLQRRDVRAIPLRALREVIVNAMMHRDYRQPRGRIIVHVIGEPATLFKVRSPGGFPPGIQEDRLLTAPSKPRNPVLARAMQLLGLAEHEGIGIDTIYLEMLGDGHVEPTIVEDSGDVLCILHGGPVDSPVRALFDELIRTAPDLGENVRAYIAVSQLFNHTFLRPESLAQAAQCTVPEALDVLVELSRASITEPLVPRSHSYRLTRPARDRLRHRLAYRPRAPIEEYADLVRAYLEGSPEIGREDAAGLMGVSSLSASRILSALYNEYSMIEPIGNSRGRGVRYRLRLTP